MTPRPKLVVAADPLRSRRLAAFLSQQQLANKAGLSLATIKELEAGADGGVRPETVRRLAAALECEPGDLAEVIEAAS